MRVASVDAWGPQRAAHMRGEHFMQRSLLQQMHEKAGRADEPLTFAIEVDALVLHLGADTLRDDAIVIDETCG